MYVHLLSLWKSDSESQICTTPYSRVLKVVSNDRQFTYVHTAVAGWGDKS